MSFSYNEKMKREYRQMFDAAIIRSGREDEVAWCVKQIEHYKPYYERIAAVIGCPWWFCGLIHGMEASFKWGWLANGDSLNGKTVRVPKNLVVPGRTPPYDFVEAGVVSLKHHGLDVNKDWSLERCLYWLESYNGWGYRYHDDNSDYLWSFTNFEKAGRYVADGKWDPNVWSNQVGCVAMLKGLIAKGIVNFEPGQTDPGIEQMAGWFEAYRIDENGQTRTGLAFLTGAEPRATWDGTDVEAMMAFLKRFPNANSILVAPASKPWPGKLEPEPKPEQPAGEIFLRVSRIKAGKLNSDGLEDLKLELVGTVEPAWTCQSGRVGKQVFEKGGPHNVAGSGYPCPQGEYYVQNFAWSPKGKDDWTGSRGAGLGPLFVRFDPKFQTPRSAFGFHWDSNHPSNTATTRESPSAGSAGCVVFRRLEELQRFAAVLRKYDPRKFVVEWGL